MSNCTKDNPNAVNQYKMPCVKHLTDASPKWTAFLNSMYCYQKQSGKLEKNKTKNNILRHSS